MSGLPFVTLETDAINEKDVDDLGASCDLLTDRKNAFSIPELCL